MKEKTRAFALHLSAFVIQAWVTQMVAIVSYRRWMGTPPIFMHYYCLISRVSMGILKRRNKSAWTIWARYANTVTVNCNTCLLQFLCGQYLHTWDLVGDKFLCCVPKWWKFSETFSMPQFRHGGGFIFIWFIKPLFFCILMSHYFLAMLHYCKQSMKFSPRQ